jgi:hypothetical protein
MKPARLAAALALLAMPASAFLMRPAQAQMPHINMIPDTPAKTPEDKAAEEARDKAYKESLRKIPDPKASSDPWGGVRSDSQKTTTAPPSKKTAAGKKSKTGSTN